MGRKPTKRRPLGRKGKASKTSSNPLAGSTKLGSTTSMKRKKVRGKGKDKIVKKLKLRR